MTTNKSVYKSIFSNKYWVVVIALACAMLWGSAFPVLKISYIELKIAPDNLSAKVALAGLRFLLASILLFGLVLIQNKPVKVKKSILPELLLSALLQISLQYFFFYDGIAHTTGMKAAILMSSGTLFVFVLAHFYYDNDKLSWKKVFGLILGFAGIMLVNYGKSFTPEFIWRGEGNLLIASLFSAFGTILSKKLSEKINPTVLTAWQMLFGSLILVGLGWPGLLNHPLVFTLKAWLLLIYSALLSAIAFSLWYSILKYNKAGETNVYMFLIPVAGAILSAIFVPGENLSVLMFAALILVAMGIVIVNRNSTETIARVAGKQ